MLIAACLSECCLLKIWVAVANSKNKATMNFTIVIDSSFRKRFLCSMFDSLLPTVELLKSESNPAAALSAKFM